MKWLTRTPSVSRVLLSALATKGPLPRAQVVELAKLIARTPQGASMALKRLQEGGAIECTYSATERGRELLAQRRYQPTKGTT